MELDPVCGTEVEPQEAEATSEYRGIEYFFCAQRCKEKFDSDPCYYAGRDARRNSFLRNLFG